jgi:single-strand DNA-binding protein
MGKNGLNKVMLIGNLGRDPEQKFLQNGGSVCTFSLGTTESYTKDGEQKERTEWHNVVFFGKLAEIAGEYLSKGSNVYLEGSLKTEKWEDRDGNKKQTTKVIGSKLIMLGARKKPALSGVEGKEGSEPGDEDNALF